MTKNEAIYQLYGLIADINEDEIADHIKTENLRMWSNIWRNIAKDALRVLEAEQKRGEFSEYADRLWEIAYERGRREALEQTEQKGESDEVDTL